MAYPSTFVDIQNEVIAKVRLDSTNDLQKVKDWINQVYTDVVIDTEALQDFGSSTLTAGTNTYDLDTTILRIKAIYSTPVGSNRTGALIPVSLEQIIDWQQANGGQQTNRGTSTHYALLGTQKIVLYPTPSAADVLTFYYVYLPTELINDNDAPILQEPYSTECLVSGTCYKAAVFLQDPNAEVYKRDYEQARARFRGHLRRKQGAGTLQFRVPKSGFLPPSDPSTDIRGWYGA